MLSLSLNAFEDREPTLPTAVPFCLGGQLGMLKKYYLILKQNLLSYYFTR